MIRVSQGLGCQQRAESSSSKISAPGDAGQFGARGQLIALGALLLLFICFILFSTIGISWKCKERIRLQHASDASAYSQAVKIARGFNYFSFTNRAIASHLVSLTTMHAYHSEISAAKGLYWNLALAYEMITAEEIALTTCVMGVGPCQFGCFAHALEDELTAISLITKNRELEKDIKELDESFIRAVEGYQSSIRLIQISQQAVQLELQAEGISSVLQKLGAPRELGEAVDLDRAMKPFNFPAGQNSSEFLELLNLSNIRRSMDFSDDDKAKVEMTEVANAARPLWVRNRLIGGNSATLSLLISRIRDDTDGQWIAAQIPVVQGAAGIYSEKPKIFPMPSSIKSQTRGRGIGSIDYWEMTGICEHNHGMGAIVQPFPLGPLDPGIIYSNINGSEHNLHSSNVEHDLDVDELLRFMRFNIESEGNYHQPIIYKLLQRDLSLNDAQKRMPWDIFDSGKFKGNIFGNNNASATVRLVSENNGSSLSKAVVYYHHPGNWREPPNFWNPFWRAKLHPFSKQELFQIEILSGQSMAAMPLAMLDITVTSDDTALEGVRN